MKGVEGVYRFLGRVWRLVMVQDQAGEWQLRDEVVEAEPSKAANKTVHATIKKVTSDIESLSFNTAISQMMVCTNDLTKQDTVSVNSIVTLLTVLNPFAPHVTEELYSLLAAKFPSDVPGQIADQSWPEHDESFLVENEIEMMIQVNGKLRDKITVAKDAPSDEIEALALAQGKVQEHTDGKTVRKVIVVPGRLVNVVAN